MSPSSVAHVYRLRLTASDPLASQPTQVRVPLKPHQRAALARMVAMESGEPMRLSLGHNECNHVASGVYNVTTNVGILGDLVGHGKTLTCLSLIASGEAPPERPPVALTFVGGHNGDYLLQCGSLNSHATATLARGAAADNHPSSEEPAVDTSATLVILPRGPVYEQWKQQIARDTSLRILAVDRSPDLRPAMRRTDDGGGVEVISAAALDNYDLVIIKSSTYKWMCDEYSFRNVRWRRVIIDEAHDELAKLPSGGVHLHSRFLWLVTSTYQLFYSFIPAALRLKSLLDGRVDLVTVRGQDDFVRASFELPQLTERVYVCKQNAIVAALHDFLNPNVQLLVNAGDVFGAVRALGGNVLDERALADAVTGLLERSLRNRTRELDAARQMEAEPGQEEAHRARVAVIEADVKRLQDRRDALVERLTALQEKACAICMEPYERPVMLGCTHVFCGECVMDWARQRAARQHDLQCPQCRAPVDMSRTVAIAANDAAPSEDADADAQPRENPDDPGTDDGDAAQPNKWTKLQMVLRILQRKPHARVLVFSKVDGAFGELKAALTEARIAYGEAKGNTAHMMCTMRAFRAGHTRVILLNTDFAGSGIDLSCATDVVIMHAMGLAKTQAVGRANRVGRTSPLVVHNLIYSVEAAAAAAGAG